ncbi:MAG: L-aspartate oxidase [Phycisphaerae bacterium]
MSDQDTIRRCLLNYDTRRLGQVFTDVLVIGAGVAGLRAAIEAAQHADVLLVTKDRLGQSNTALAQGGIAAVTDPADSFEAHIADTLQVGCGLNDPRAVETIAREGPARVEELIAWGAAFDLDKGEVALGREAGHSARRIVHALGDATGRELSRALVDRTRRSPRVRVFEDCFVIDLAVDSGECLGALTFHEKYGHQIIWAGQTILASGGAGRLFRETTNGPGATADGHAIALRAGARLRDMEFVQFHPTALYIAGAARALISEAVRGEGAYLVDRAGERFMPSYHPDAELAPRDVVSRSILRRMMATDSTTVYLDVRHFPDGAFAARFPHIDALCRDFDIDAARELIPVRPAAHYMIGGVAVDIDGRSSVEGLWACGEAAATGVHGANRLASNSLLEGLVFGKRIGAAAARRAAERAGPRTPRPLRHQIAPSSKTELDLPDVCNSLRALCWRNLGIERNGDRLRETLEIIDFWRRYVMDKVEHQRAGWEIQNMLMVARCVALSAQRRTESRGVHFRTDYPEADDAAHLGHVTLQVVDGAVQLGLEPVDPACPL